MSLNLYTYVQNNPLIYVDPTGHYLESDNFELRNQVSQYTTDWNNANAKFQKATKYSSEWWSAKVAMDTAHGKAEEVRTNYWANFRVKEDLGPGTVTLKTTCNDCVTELPVWKDPIAYLIGGTLGVSSVLTVIKIVNAGERSKDISNEVSSSQRTGSANKLDADHAFPDIIDNYASSASRFSLPKKSGGSADLYQIEGSYSGKDGVFEWIIDGGQVTHRRFISNVGITGRPNARPQK